MLKIGAVRVEAVLGPPATVYPASQSREKK